MDIQNTGVKYFAIPLFKIPHLFLSIYPLCKIQYKLIYYKYSIYFVFQRLTTCI